MKEIRLGLKDNLNVLSYANLKYNWELMGDIRKLLLKESTL